MSELAQTFTKKLGPFPAWAWIGIGAGVGLLYLRRKSAASSSTAGVPGGTLGYGGGQQLGTGNGFGGWDLSGGGGGGGGGGGDGGTGGVVLPPGDQPIHAIFLNGQAVSGARAYLDALIGNPPTGWKLQTVEDKFGNERIWWFTSDTPQAAPALPAGGSTHAGVAGAIAAPVATLAPRGASGGAGVPSTAPVVSEGWR